MKINLDNKSIEIDKEISIKDLLNQLEEAGLKDYTSYKIIVKNTINNFLAFKEDKCKEPYNPLINRVMYKTTSGDDYLTNNHYVSDIK